MVWGALIGGLFGIGSSLLNSQAQSSAIAEQNRINEEVAKRQYARAVKEYELENSVAKTQWMWDQARVEQLRAYEKQASVDRADWNAKLIDAAQRNLQINTGALYDRFVVEENLRAKEVDINYNYTQDKLSAEAGEQVRQYLVDVNNLALESNLLRQETNTNVQDILDTFVIEEQRDKLGWQLSQIAALAKDSETRAAAVTRQGGGATSQRLAIDAAQALGRTWGELDLKAKSRDMKMSLMNSTINNEVATKYGQIALQAQDRGERMKYTNTRMVTDQLLAQDQLKELTIPSFALAQNQYGRETQSLQLQTDQALNEASIQYREQPYQDVLEPVAGLAPEYYGPTAMKSPSSYSVIGNAITAGIGGALQFSYKNAGGGLSFY
jgi:hypothetical protein